MLRKHSKIKLIIISIIAILGILFCVCPFAIPNSTDVFKGFIPGIRRGIELNGGVESVYSCTLKEGETVSLDEARTDAITKIRKLYSAEDTYELYVENQGQDKISILMSGEKDRVYAGNSLYDYLENPKELYITVTEKSESVQNPELYVFPTDVKNVVAGYNDDYSEIGLKLYFNQEGRTHIKELKEYTNSTVYIYMGNELLTSVDVDDVKNGMFVTNSSISSDQGFSAREAAHNIIAGSFRVELTNISTTEVTPILGLNVQLYLSIALIVLVVAAFVMMYVRYGHLGLLADLAMLFYIVLFSFIVMAIPLAILNLAGVVACVIAFAIALISNCYIFEKIRAEYALGKKIHIACKNGFKNALWGVLDTHAAGALASVCVWIFAPASFKIVGIVLLVGFVLSTITSLALTRYFVHIYLPINSTKAKKLRLYREKGVKELPEVEIIPEDQVSADTEEAIDHE